MANLEGLIGSPLPNAERAEVREEKLRLYALSLEHRRGRDKARVFRAVLDLGEDDWEYLRNEIVKALPKSPVTDVRPPRSDKGAYTFEVLVPITGLNGRRALVITAWELAEGVPRLVTARVAPKGRQPRELRVHWER